MQATIKPATTEQTQQPQQTQQTPPAQPARAPWLRLLPEDGWLTIILLVIVVFTTTATIQNVTPVWADGLDILTATTAFGLLLGYLSVQQGRLPTLLVQIVAAVLGAAFAFQQTTDRVVHGDRLALLSRTQEWFHRTVLLRQSSDDNAVFLLFLAFLSYLLAYLSVWLVLHTRRPWLAALANGVVLLINLNSYAEDRAVFFLVVFLLSTLLLIVRFTLADNMRRWKARGMRFSPDLTWDFMQAGAIFVVIVMLLSYLLPVGVANASLSTAWNDPTNPVQSLANRVAVMFSGAGGKGPGTFSFFSTNLQLSGSPQLPDVKILSYTVPNTLEDPGQYLATETLDTYDGRGSWSSSVTDTTNYKAGDVHPSSTNLASTATYHITLLVPMEGNHLFTPGSQAASFSVDSQELVSSSGFASAWYASQHVNQGESYSATGYVAAATDIQLRAVPYPYDLTSADRTSLYPDELLREYQAGGSGGGIAPDVIAKAKELAQGTQSMYDAALRIEDYLRTFHYSLQNPDVPPGRDAVSYFLQVKTGYCTFFASAMALMGRSLGMPTRIVEGFSSGIYNDKTRTYDVKGTEAHVWPQIYFGKYGWINFEPTASFGKFSRAIGSGGNTGPTPITGTPGPGQGTPTPKGPNDKGDTGVAGGGGGSGPNSTLVAVGIGSSLFVALVLLCLALAMTWWRLLYRGFSPVTAAFARVARLGAWAGAPPRRYQTPDEYAETLGAVLPAQRQTLRRLSDIYTRERWGGGAAQDALKEVPGLYDRVRVAASRVIAHRLRDLPAAAAKYVRRRGRARRRMNHW